MNEIDKKDKEKAGLFLEKIGWVEDDFPAKFGLPRQSGLAKSLRARIRFEKEYNNRDAFRGLAEFSHIWVLWGFSETTRENWSPTVRPPKLGGNKRIGVFATRSPFRPNPIALSCVKLERAEWDEKEGMVLLISGADMMSGTPVYDIKPYIPYADSYPGALGSFAAEHQADELTVKYQAEIPKKSAYGTLKEKSADFEEDLITDTKAEMEKCLQELSEEQKNTLTEILSKDPRPAYQRDPDRVYILSYAGYEVSFQVKEEILTVIAMQKTKNQIESV